MIVKALNIVWTFALVLKIRTKFLLYYSANGSKISVKRGRWKSIKFLRILVCAQKQSIITSVFWSYRIVHFFKSRELIRTNLFFGSAEDFLVGIFDRECVEEELGRADPDVGVGGSKVAPQNRFPKPMDQLLIVSSNNNGTTLELGTLYIISCQKCLTIRKKKT
jgi:hypothetical protein